MLMQDDRGRYLDEAEPQADGLADYVIHFIAADRGRHPGTIELDILRTGDRQSRVHVLQAAL